MVTFSYYTREAFLLEIYKLRYDVGGSSGKTIVLVADISKRKLEDVLAERDRHFKTDTMFCRITHQETLTKDQVSMSDLSFGDFMRLFQDERGFRYNG